MAAQMGKRKAAMLLAGLDADTATELLKGQPEELVQEIAIELSRLDATGQVEPEELAAVVKEFSGTLQKVGSGGLHVQSFIRTILKNSNGRGRSADIHAQMQQAMRDKDPFMAIKSAAPGQIAAALKGESPQAVALVMGSLPPKLATEVLSRLDDEMRLKSIWRMAKPEDISPQTIRRVGEMVCKRLVELTSEEMTGGFDENARRETLRKVGLVLSGLTKEHRDIIMSEIEERDEDTANMVKSLMVTWEDILKVEDKSLQGVLRKIDSSVLAKALFGAEPAISQKIRSNISERAAESIDEETSLMAEPRKKEILEAREAVAKPLRDANEAEELVFIEE
jgi:flagellar motor switch protein FliG